MLLYIHGFRTTTHSYKATLLKNHYQDKIIASAHSFVPDEAIKNLEENIEIYNVTGIIASSLGGFYATYLSQKYNLKTVLINPSVKPYKTTKQYLGKNKRQDETKFTWKEEHIEMLKKYKVDKQDLNLENFYLFLQTGDEVLDYRVAEKFYNGVQIVSEEGGNHRFQDFDRFFDDVTDFLNQET